MIRNDMSFGSFLDATIRYYEPPEYVQTQGVQNSDCEEAITPGMPSKTDSGTSSPMTWQERGDFHLNRNELDLAIHSFTKALQQAEKQHDREKVGNCIKNLGIVYLKKEQWALSAKLFNAAYAVLQTIPNGNGRQIILGLMSEVEKRFLNKVCGKEKNLDPKIYLQWRERLEQIRGKFRFEIFQSSNGNKKMDDLGTPFYFSEVIEKFLQNIFESGFSIFGKAPCAYAVISLGSLARWEMCPYSDLEFALIIEKEKPEILNYFRQLIQWFELQIINLGETEIKILDNGNYSPVVSGICFDTGGNTPLGKKDYIELIKTPSKLAELQSERFYKEDIILSNVLRNVGFMFGNISLCKKYNQEIESILKSKSSDSNEPLYKERALNLLKGHLIEFEPRLAKEEAHKFNVKFALFRLLSFLIGGVAEYVGIKSLRTRDKINELRKMNILCEKGAKNLHWALSMAMGLRICTQIFYGRECEDTYYLSEQVRKFEQPSWMGTEEEISEMGWLGNAVSVFDVHVFYYRNVKDNFTWLKEFNQRVVFVPNEACLEKIARIYSILIPFHQAVKQACETRNFGALIKDTFENIVFRELGKKFETLSQLHQAKYCYLREHLLHPNDFENLLDLIRIFQKLEHDGYAEKYARDALEKAPEPKKKILETLIEQICNGRNSKS